VKKFAMVLGTVFGAFLIVRGIAEPFVIDMSDPATYREDWGGPGLFGVLAVHCGPGLVSAALMGSAVRRSLRRRRSAAAHG
jgi:hypothetical protein